MNDELTLAKKEIRRLQKERREALKYLQDVVDAATIAVQEIDRLMPGPSTPEKGKRIAAVTNALEVAKDRARFGPLGIDFRTGKPRKPAV